MRAVVGRNCGWRRAAEGAGWSSSRGGLAAATLLAFVLAGCGTVEVTEPDGTRRVHLHLGPVLLDAPPSGTVVGRLSALGLARTPTGVALGYVAEEVTVVPDDCRILVWITSADEARAVRDSLTDLAQVCTAVSPASE